MQIAVVVVAHQIVLTLNEPSHLPAWSGYPEVNLLWEAMNPMETLTKDLHIKLG